MVLAFAFTFPFELSRIFSLAFPLAFAFALRGRRGFAEAREVDLEGCRDERCEERLDLELEEDLALVDGFVSLEGFGSGRAFLMMRLYLSARSGYCLTKKASAPC